MSPLLSLLLLHDHFFSKNGIAASSNHVLRQSVERHKARLQAEFTKARLLRKCSNIDSLKEKLEKDRHATSGDATEQPRWVRVNRIKAVTAAVLEDAFDEYEPASSMSELLRSNKKLYWKDVNIPDLLAFPLGTNLTKTKAYETSEIILQDKASCFPAHLLLGDESPDNSRKQPSFVGDIIDACAAPGNKTTHLAGIVASSSTNFKAASKHKIFACERDASRSEILQSMISKAGATNVHVLPKQDFLSLDPSDVRFRKVTHLLLDPSCSGSGILGRKDIPTFNLPAAAPLHPLKGQSQDQSKCKGELQPNKKRKTSHAVQQKPINATEKVAEMDEYTPSHVDESRLQRLSHLQRLIIEHAFSFPSATHVTYSTCSIHQEENENVVARVLRSNVAQDRNWKLLLREQHVKGLREWKHRGMQPTEGRKKSTDTIALTQAELDACIRCQPGDQEGTMGFFVCCFLRHAVEVSHSGAGAKVQKEADPVNGVQDSLAEEWSGFSDDE